MIRSAITISLVEEARGGPFVLWHNLPGNCRTAADLGFHAVEIFPPAPDAFVPADVLRLTGDMGLAVAAIGTGAGWVKHKLTLTHADPAIRRRAIDFAKRMIDLAAELRAPAIIGSMQGRFDDVTSRNTALSYLSDALNELGKHAESRGQILLYEPLNRYETNLVNNLGDGVSLLQSLSTRSVKLLADLFHLNIEEVDIAAAVRLAGDHIGHVHFVDSNRRPAGAGHLHFAPIVSALYDIGYGGYASAEALPLPNPDAAARMALEGYRKFILNLH
jgi:sugar phosphate isomerase/epimerase